MKTTNSNARQVLASAVKKLLSLFLSLVMLLSITAGLDFSSYAESSGDYEYIVSNGTATITRYKGKSNNVKIPSKIDGYTVTNITSYEKQIDEFVFSTYGAFSGCKKIKSITIPDTVTNIGEEAFAWCINLENVTMGKKIKTIGDCAFICCEKLNSITLPESLTSIGYSAFDSCSSLTSITIPKKVKNISDCTFSACYSLKKVTIPNGVTKIGNSAFGGCINLKTLTIPNSVTNIGDDAFELCKSLTDIKVESKNKKFVSKDGILFNKSKTKLIKYPANNKKSTYTIPNSVTDISNGALEYCKNLTEIKVGSKNKNYTSKDGVLFNKNKTIIIQYPCGNTRKTYSVPNGVVDIFQGFIGCKLNSIVIPESVNMYWDQCFTDCKNFTDIYYKGSKTKWNSICGGGSVMYDSVKYIPSPTIQYNYKNHKHKWNKGKVTKKATYTSTGKKVYKCSVGNETKTEIIPKLKLSVPGAVKISAISKGFKLSWKRNTETTGYQIQYSTSSDFKNAKTVTISSNKTTSKKITKLKAKKKYYVRIRTYKTVKVNDKNTKVYSSWSKTKTVKTK